MQQFPGKTAGLRLELLELLIILYFLIIYANSSSCDFQDQIAKLGLKLEFICSYLVLPS